MVKDFGGLGGMGRKEGEERKGKQGRVKQLCVCWGGGGGARFDWSFLDYNPRQYSGNMVKDVSELNGERWEGEKRVLNDVQGRNSPACAQ